MVIADTLLAAREDKGKPIRVGMVGAGTTGRMIALQLAKPVPGIRLVAVANRTVDKAETALVDAGLADAATVDRLSALEDRVEQLRPTAVADFELLCQASNIDIVVEVTGTVEFGARVALAAIGKRKHVVLVNAELDATLGPILKRYADRAGVTITNTDGDEPGVAMTLLRYIRSIGLRPVAAGNLKGMIDPYRTPETQRAFAEKFKQDAAKVTSFADGTKLSMELSILANATGFQVGQRGMYGPECADVKEMSSRLPAEKMLETGLVDYALGAAPHTGAFVIGYEDHPRRQQELAYYKMGDGPFYVFYTPYHLPHIQIASTIGRAVLFNDATVAPLSGPRCEVMTAAKRDLKAGERLDGVGGFLSYGIIENADTFRRNRFLAMGLSEGCILANDVAKDQSIGIGDVKIPQDRLQDRLKSEQDAYFSVH